MTALYRILFIAGFGLFLVGTALPRYHDQKKYEQRSAMLQGPTRSKEYHELRRQSLTHSLKIQDYGVTTILIGVLVLAGSRWRALLGVLPKERFTAAFLGALAAVAVIAGEVGALFLDYARDEFPPWADSLGIPLAGMPVMLVVLSIWAGLHALLVTTRKDAALRLTLGRWNWWLALLILITALFLIACVVDGHFWQIIPCALWITFYLSIWISRSSKECNQSSQSKAMAKLISDFDSRSSRG